MATTNTPTLPTTPLHHAARSVRAAPGVPRLWHFAAEYLLLLFVSRFLITGAVAYPAALSSLRGLALIQTIAVAHFGVHHLLTLVEATVFLPRMSATEVGMGVFSGAIDSAVLAVCVAAALGKLGPRVDKFGTDISCTTEEARAAAVKAAVDSGSPTRMMNVAIAFAQQISDKALTAESKCVLGAKGAIGEALGTCVAA